MGHRSAKPTGVLRQRAIIGHGFWGRGGAEIAAMQLLAALAPRFDLHVYTWGGFDLNELNSCAGTDVHAENVHLHLAPVAEFGPLKFGAYVRSLRDVSEHFDLRVSVSNVLHWRRPAIHFLSSISWHSRIASNYLASLPKRQRFKGEIIRYANSAISGASSRDLRHDMFIANSLWTKERCRQVCPGEIRVVYPPIKLADVGAPWGERRGDILMFGRVAPEKQIEKGIELVRAARARGFSGHLVIAGASGDEQYYRRIQELCDRDGDWIRLLPLQLGAEKERLLRSVRYGLSCCEVEAFGIATAEMAACGILTFVPAGSGQDEIVGNSLLRYRTQDEAAAQLSEIERSPDLQLSLHEEANAGRERFSFDRFAVEVNEAVDDFMARCAKPQS